MNHKPGKRTTLKPHWFYKRRGRTKARTKFMEVSGCSPNLPTDVTSSLELHPIQPPHPHTTPRLILHTSNTPSTHLSPLCHASLRSLWLLQEDTPVPHSHNPRLTFPFLAVC